MKSGRIRWRAARPIQERARELRKDMTPAEKKLWSNLRNGQICGAHFRKQHPVGPFIIDFFCAKAKLAIEVDGGVHQSQIDYDLERSKWLVENKGYKILRFTNDQIESNIESVIEKIIAALCHPPPP
ncbi:MAG: DUF559 domain-containing protein [Anaerolineales bacterium]|nr:DUF559 domain-containing protein [Anaerolineales bacterium]